MQSEWSKEFAAIEGFALALGKASLVILGVLYARYPRLVLREDLEKLLTAGDADNTLSVTIHRLRSQHQLEIECVRNRGYRLSTNDKHYLDELCQRRLSHLIR